MSTSASVIEEEEPAVPTRSPAAAADSTTTKAPQPARPHRQKSSLFSYGEPMVWLTGGALAIALAMILLLIGTVLYRGLGTFWPKTMVAVTLQDGSQHLGSFTRRENGKDADGKPYNRSLLWVANADMQSNSFRWIDDHQITSQAEPEWAMTVERLDWGPFFGHLVGFQEKGQVVADSPEAAWQRFNEIHAEVRNRWYQARSLEKHQIRTIEERNESHRIDIVKAKLKYGEDSPQYRKAVETHQQFVANSLKEREKINERIHALDAKNEGYALLMRSAMQQNSEATEQPTKIIAVAEVVRAYPANQLNLGSSIGVYLDRWSEFLFDDPRESNMYGGVWPCIVGTLVMTLSMTVLVVPFGVIAALYLREYARQGLIVSMVRISINNLAGVPSIVFGVFGLGFFCVMVGGGLDSWLFPAHVAESKPVLGKEGMIWAAITMSLLTLPVVIVATEEALSAVPGSIREASYGCGASKWQTMQRIVLPHALPGILTGTILAMARGAGEVAPLMLVGAVHLAPELPVVTEFPYISDLGLPFVTNNSFMHLGYHIYTVGFQSPDSEAARPMVYTTTLLLIGIIAVLNIMAIWLRGRLNAKYAGNQF